MTGPDRLLGSLNPWRRLKELERENARLRDKIRSDVDPLTGTVTIAGFQRQIGQAIARAQRQEQMVAVVLLNLVRFGRINEFYGHEAGDQILREVAARLEAAVRQSDSVGRAVGDTGNPSVVSRLGGDTFVILLEGFGEAKEAALVVERILERLSEPLSLGDTPVSLTSRAGIGFYPKDGLDSSSLLKSAEVAIHYAETPGASSPIGFYSKSVAVQHHREVDLEAQIRKAITDGSFDIAYQPKVSLAKGHPIGFEALLRYSHPEEGPVSALTVIELAERTGLIRGLGEAIFRRVCRDAEGLRAATGVATRLFTNFSPRQLEMRDWGEVVERILSETGVDPNIVGIEITESALVDDRQSLISSLERLVSAGVEISLDDFGTGYSHLGYLSRLPLHELKIDRSFVVDIEAEQEHSHEVAGLIVLLGRTLGMRVVAEGAETKSQVEALGALGCHAVQGYYFSRPQPLEAFFEGVRQGRVIPAGAPDSTG